MECNTSDLVSRVSSIEKESSTISFTKESRDNAIDEDTEWFCLVNERKSGFWSEFKSSDSLTVQ